MTFWSALILGLVASAHCAGMCGGLQMAIQSASLEKGIVVRSSKEKLHYLILLNFGRVFTYAVAGFLFSLLGAATLSSIDIPSLAYWLRLFTGFFVVLIGVQLMLSTQRPFAFLEPAGAFVWARVSKFVSHSKGTHSAAFANGLIWGFLPCGLVYGVLLSAVVLNQPPSAALVMMGFGIGTIPALVLTGAAYQKFRSIVHKSAVQVFTACVFIVGGVAIITSPYWVDKSFLQDYPLLLNTVFCLT